MVETTMLNKLDDAKAELLDRAAQVPGPEGASRDSSFLHRYYRRVAPEDLLGRDPVDVAGAAYSHFELAASRPQGTARNVPSASHMRCGPSSWPCR